MKNNKIRGLKKIPLVSIVIVNWNGRYLLDDCIKSILNQSYRNYEIIVVDNYSSDGSADFIREKYNIVLLIQNSENSGFAKGNNIGIKHSKGEYILVLNPDVRLEPDAIHELIEVAEKDPKIGICASKMLLYDNPKIINSVGMVLCRNGCTRHLGDGEIDDGRYNQIQEVFAVSGAAMFCRRKMLEDVGLFDEDYFAYFEDLDLGWRARLIGWKCVYVPTSNVYHLRNATVKKYPKVYEKARYYEQRNRIWTLLKNFSFLTLFLNLPSLIKYEFSVLSRSVYRFIKIGRYPVEIKARLDVFRDLYLILQKRHEQQKKRILSESSIRQWILKC